MLQALVRFHPDRAIRRGDDWRGVVEAEETYKFVQTLYEERDNPSSSSRDNSSSSAANSAEAAEASDPQPPTHLVAPRCLSRRCVLCRPAALLCRPRLRLLCTFHLAKQALFIAIYG